MRTANFKSAAIAALLSMGLLTGCTNGITNQKTSNHMDTLNLTQEWDKKFPQSDKVNHRKVTFKNRYGISIHIAMKIVYSIFSGKLSGLPLP